MWQTPNMMRRMGIVVVTVVGVCAVTATSPVEPPSFPVTSPQKSITLSLDETQPEVRFAITIDSTVANPSGFNVRAEIAVDDDSADVDDTDGIAVLDIGLVDPGAALPDDVDVAGDASVASVQEGSFGVERVALDDEVILIARLRDGIPAARVTFSLTASTLVFDEAPGADETLSLTVAPDEAPVDGAPEVP